MFPFRWACLLEGSLDDPWTVAVATRKTVALFDARRGGNGGGGEPRVLCRSARGEPLDEIITAVARDDAVTFWILLDASTEPGNKACVVS